jgi:ubiquitin C-terminal hydrolase
MKGLQNIGNNCYINASLQLLIQNKDLCFLLISYSNKSDSNILKIIANFISMYHNDTIKVVNPIEIKKIVEMRNNIFVGNNQHDSIEFFIYLLDIIDTEIKKINNNSKGVYSIFNTELNTSTKCKYLKCLNINNKKKIIFSYYSILIMI